jgi:hypothetical protein
MKMHLIKTNDDVLYEVIHQEPETKQIDAEKLKIKYYCTDVFRKDGQYWFVRKIEEAQVIEENLENQ